MHGRGNVFAGHSLLTHAVIGVEDLQRGGQIVIHKFTDLGQLFRILLHLCKNLFGKLLQTHDLGRDGRIGNIVVQPLHLRNRLLPIGYHLIQLRVAGSFRFLRNLLHGTGAKDPGHNAHHSRGGSRQQKMGQPVQGKQQGIQQPCGA